MSTYYHAAMSGGRGGANDDRTVTHDDRTVTDPSEASSPGTKTLLSERLKQVMHSSQTHSHSGFWKVLSVVALRRKYTRALTLRINLYILRSGTLRSHTLRLSSSCPLLA